VAVESSVRLRVDGSSAVRELNRVNKATGALQGAVGKLLGGFAAADLARRFFKGFAEAEKAAAAVRTLGVDSGKLRRELLGVSNELGGLIGQTELTAAAYDVASAGFTNAAAAANVLKAASLGAIGGLADLNTVADATTSVLNAYGLSSDKAAKLVDGFIQTQNDGKIIVAQYAAQIGRVAPVAAAAGVGIEDLNAAISTVTAQGVPVESTFAGIRQIIAGVLKPTAEAAKVAKTLGIEFNTAAIKAKGFGGFLADVVEKTGGSETALTQLFGSVEAISALLPLTNDGLVTFNKNLDNQANSAGAAKDATKELGGTVTSQVTKIVNNIGNVARALDTVLGPALKFILQDLNNIISAASTAISKFTDLATGALSRSAAALQFAASTGTTSESAFTSLKEAIGTLRPELAQSETDLLKLEGALDEAGRAALRFSGKSDFGRLRNEVLDTITAMRQLIVNRREALGKGSQPAGTAPAGTDPEVEALRARIEALLAQVNSKSGAKTPEQIAADALKDQQERAKQFLHTKKQEALLTGNITDKQRRGLEHVIEKMNLSRMFPKLSEDELQVLRDQLDVNFNLSGKDRERIAAAKLLKQEQDEQLRQYREMADVIENGIKGAIMGAIDGSKSLGESLSGILRQLGGMFLNKGIGSFKNQDGTGGSGVLGMFANGGRPPVGRPSIVGERGPELFVPSRAGTIIPNHELGGSTSVVVNVDASGTEVQGNQGNADQLGRLIGQAVQAELIKQKRPGGLLTR